MPTLEELNKVSTLCVHVCVHVCVHMSVHRSKDNLRYHFSEGFYLFLSPPPGFHTGLGLADEGSLAGQRTLGIHLSVFSVAAITNSLPSMFRKQWFWALNTGLCAFYER